MHRARHCFSENSHRIPTAAAPPRAGPAPLPQAPTIEPRLVLHPAPRIDPRTLGPVTTPTVGECDGSPAPIPSESPLPPPWKVPAWEIPPQPLPKVKITVYRPDIIHKGSLI